MNSYSKLILLLFVVHLSFVLSSCSSVPVNLQTAKKEVQDYYESGSYSSELKKIIASAEDEINNVKLNKNSIVVFDVDETALSNYEAVKRVHFGYVESMWYDWINEAKAPAIPEVKALYDFVVSKNINVVFITGRDNSQYDATYRNLKNAGYTKFDTLILKNNTPNIATGKFKAGKREELTQKGYDIIASVGDQESDFEGKDCGIKIKLPNYLYLIN
jgi:predicted secreted acid phosphatase